MAKRGGLGKGLEALLTTGLEEDGPRVENISLDMIKPNPSQPRKDFDEERLEALALSIVEHGVLQPIVVRKIQGGYEIVAGERRYRASREAGLKEIPALVKDMDDELQARLAMVENLQREDLDIIEEAQGYKLLQDSYDISQTDLGELVGKSRAYISNTLRLLGLDQEIQDYISKDQLSAGHGRALLMFPEDKRLNMAKMAIEKGLSVRALEALSKERPKMITKDKDPHIRDLEDRLTSSLGTKVNINLGKNKSTMEISFYNTEDLEELIDKLLK